MQSLFPIHFGRVSPNAAQATERRQQEAFRNWSRTLGELQRRLAKDHRSLWDHEQPIALATRKLAKDLSLDPDQSGGYDDELWLKALNAGSGGELSPSLGIQLCALQPYLSERVFARQTIEAAMFCLLHTAPAAYRSEADVLTRLLYEIEERRVPKEFLVGVYPHLLRHVGPTCNFEQALYPMALAFTQAQRARCRGSMDQIERLCQARLDDAAAVGQLQRFEPALQILVRRCAEARPKKTLGRPPNEPRKVVLAMLALATSPALQLEQVSDPNGWLQAANTHNAQLATIEQHFAEADSCCDEEDSMGVLQQIGLAASKILQTFGDATASAGPADPPAAPDQEDASTQLAWVLDQFVSALELRRRGRPASIEQKFDDDLLAFCENHSLTAPRSLVISTDMRRREARYNLGLREALSFFLDRIHSLRRRYGDQPSAWPEGFVRITPPEAHLAPSAPQPDAPQPSAALANERRRPLAERRGPAVPLTVQTKSTLTPHSTRDALRSPRTPRTPMSPTTSVAYLRATSTGHRSHWAATSPEDELEEGFLQASDIERLEALSADVSTDRIDDFNGHFDRHHWAQALAVLHGIVERFDADGHDRAAFVRLCAKCLKGRRAAGLSAALQESWGKMQLPSLRDAWQLLGLLVDLVAIDRWATQNDDQTLLAFAAWKPDWEAVQARSILGAQLKHYPRADEATKGQAQQGLRRLAGLFGPSFGFRLRALADNEATPQAATTVHDQADSLGDAVEAAMLVWIPDAGFVIETDVDEPGGPHRWEGRDWTAWNTLLHHAHQWQRTARQSINPVQHFELLAKLGTTESIEQSSAMLDEALGQTATRQSYAAVATAGLPPDSDLTTSPIDVEQQPDADHDDQQAGAAITKQRERDTDDGEDTDDHADVDDGLPDEQASDAAGQENSIRFFGAQSDVASEQSEQEVQAEQ